MELQGDVRARPSGRRHARVAHSDRLDAAFAALADPTRRAIIARLTLGEASVTELARPFAMSQPAISKHLKVLERAGLVSRRRDAQRRPCRLNAPALRDATEWLDGYRQFWAESYERLDELLAELQSPADATDHHERGTDSGAENRAEEGAGS